MTPLRAVFCILVASFAFACGEEPERAADPTARAEPAARAGSEDAASDFEAGAEAVPDEAVLAPEALAEAEALIGALEAADELDESDVARVAVLLLHDDDPERRARAAGLLAEAEGPGATDALTAALRDPEPAVVIAALEALEWREDAAAIGEIERLLDAPDPDVAEAARDVFEILSEDD